MEKNSSFSARSLFDSKIEELYLTQFWLFTCLLILSIVCILFSLYILIVDRIQRQSLHNHGIIIILIIDFISECVDVSLYTHYFRCYLSFPSTHTFRLIWGYIDYPLLMIQFALYAWITIERHILIFHDSLVSTMKKRILIHYIPPIGIILYYIIFYSIIIFGIECDNHFDKLNIPSFYPCAFQNQRLYMYQTIVHSILPIFIIVISSLFLLLRVICQKYRIHRHIHWRQHRRMSIQIFFISSIYLIFTFPYTILAVIQISGISSYIISQLSFYLMFFPMYTLLLFPMVTLGSLPKLKEKFKQILTFRRQQHAVVPINLTMTRNKNTVQVIQSII